MSGRYQPVCEEAVRKVWWVRQTAFEAGRTPECAAPSRTDPVNRAVIEAIRAPLDAENVRLREALAAIRDTDSVDAALDPDRARRIAREALDERGDL